MITINTILQPYYLFGNIPNIEYLLNKNTSFVIKRNGVIVHNESRIASSNTLVRLYVSQYSDINPVDHCISTSTKQLSTLEIIAEDADGVIKKSLKYLPGILIARCDSYELYFKSNFLTSRPRQVCFGLFHPICLSYAALVGCVCRIKIYYSEGSTVVDYVRCSANMLYHFDLSYSTVKSLVDVADINKYEVWIEMNGIKLTYVQEFYYRKYRYDEDVFMWLNNFGGIDSAIIVGELSLKQSYKGFDYISAGKRSCQLYGIHNQYVKKCDNINSYSIANWLLTLISSDLPCIYTGGELLDVNITPDDCNIIRSDINKISFSFSLSDEKKSIVVNSSNHSVIEINELELIARAVLGDLPRSSGSNALLLAQEQGDNSFVALDINDIDIDGGIID